MSADRKIRKLRVETQRELEKRPLPAPETYHRRGMLKRLRDSIEQIPTGPTRAALELLMFMEAQR